MIQCVLGDAEEKSRRSSVIEAYITAGIRTLYLSNTSLDSSISCCFTVIRIKRTEEPQNQEETENAEICSYSKINKMHLLSQIIYSRKTLYMFWTVFPSIIRSSRLHIQHQTYVKQLLLTAAV